MENRVLGDPPVEGRVLSEARRAISASRGQAAVLRRAVDEHGVTFRWKDYRAKGHTRYRAMTLDAGEFMRRFLLHVLPGGFHGR